jgi:hypothetical protein
MRLVVVLLHVLELVSDQLPLLVLVGRVWQLVVLLLMLLLMQSQVVAPARLLPLVLVRTKLHVLVVVLVVVVRLHMLVLVGNRLMWPMLVCKGLLMEVLQLRLMVMQ